MTNVVQEYWRMARLREKLAGLAEERDALEEPLAMLKGGETRLRELGSLPSLVETYLRDLPYLVGRESELREYEAVPADRTEDNPLEGTPLRRSASATSPRRS